MIRGSRSCACSDQTTRTNFLFLLAFSKYRWQYYGASAPQLMGVDGDTLHRYMEDVIEMGIKETIQRAREVVTGDSGNEGTPTYLTFDIDSLDPIYAPGTGTPEAGGLTTR